MADRRDRAPADRWHRVRMAGVLLGLLTAALAACGGDSGGEKSAGRQAPQPVVPAGNVARAGGALISRESLAHWTKAVRLQRQCKTERRCRNQALKFLVSAQWVLQEAEARGISATNSDVTESFTKQKREAFASERKYRAYVRRSGRTEDDLRFQVKVQLLTRRLQERVQRKGLKSSEYGKDLRRRYKARTTCLRPYRISACGKVIDP